MVRPKAPEDWRSPRRWRRLRCPRTRASVLECGGPPPLPLHLGHRPVGGGPPALPEPPPRFDFGGCGRAEMGSLPRLRTLIPRGAGSLPDGGGATPDGALAIPFAGGGTPQRPVAIPFGGAETPPRAGAIPFHPGNAPIWRSGHPATSGVHTIWWTGHPATSGSHTISRGEDPFSRKRAGFGENEALVVSRPLPPANFPASSRFTFTGDTTQSAAVAAPGKVPPGRAEGSRNLRFETTGCCGKITAASPSPRTPAGLLSREAHGLRRPEPALSVGMRRKEKLRLGPEHSMR